MPTARDAARSDPHATARVLLGEYEAARRAFGESGACKSPDPIAWTLEVHLARIRYEQAREDLHRHVAEHGEVEDTRGYWKIGPDGGLCYARVPEWEALACSA